MNYVKTDEKCLERLDSKCGHTTYVEGCPRSTCRVGWKDTRRYPEDLYPTDHPSAWMNGKPCAALQVCAECGAVLRYEHS